MDTSEDSSSLILHQRIDRAASSERNVRSREASDVHVIIRVLKKIMSNLLPTWKS